MRRRALAAVAAVALVGAAGGVVAATRGHQAPSVGSAGPALATVIVHRTTLTATDLVDGTLGWAPSPPVVTGRSGTWTALPALGQVIRPGQALAAVDGRPIVLLPGLVPAWRALHTGVPDGADVKQLETALHELGYDPAGRMTVDAHFTAATAAAVARLQRALSEAPTGRVEDGDVVFAAAPLRIGALRAVLGGRSSPGDTPFDVTGTDRVVTVQLDPGRDRTAVVGQPVTVDLLDGRTTTGRISDIARVASPPGQTTGQGAASPTVPMTVTLADPSAVGQLDQAPVQVQLTTTTASDALAVPITALLALADGGYGVEVVRPDGRHQVVPVRPGLFTDSMVAITGGAVTDGTIVVTAR